MISEEIRERVIDLAKAAGDAIMRVYESEDLGVSTKEDESPLTHADKASHRVLSVLEGLRGLPLISEEGVVPSYSRRSEWSSFWLIDPLDGTKEFINRNGEFTVNIALIQDRRAVFGVVYVPVTGVTYVGGVGYPSVRIDDSGEHEIRVSASHDEPIRVVASRSHMNQETKSYIERIAPAHVVPAGSSLKFCRVAEGAADVYPRLGPTMEWDTAAAQAIVEAAGGNVITGDSALGYNREDMVNPHFLVAAPWVLERYPVRVGVA